jgi:catechol 2,3-dioxygenase-like lactoylglutathione lyase family enzyme
LRRRAGYSLPKEDARKTVLLAATGFFASEAGIHCYVLVHFPVSVSMTIAINGMAHVILTVSRFDAAREFYRRLLPEFGMKVVSDSDRFFYCVGARTAIGIEPCDPALAGERFVQQRVGLHHLCLRARSREDVDKCAALLREMGATIVRGPAEDTWAPGYYSVLFEDPDGIRLEVNFVPGAGLLAEGAQFRPGPPNMG